MLSSLRLVGLVCLLLVPSAARADVPVSVLGIQYVGEVPPALRPLLPQRLAAGLTAAGLRVIVEPEARPQGCAEAGCWQQLARRAGCRYLVSGQVAGEDRTYQINLRLVDGHSGSIAAEASERCEICGQEALGQKVELAASALRAKLSASVRAPARLQVITEPRGAELSVDGRSAGAAPRELELSPGSHEIVAAAPGFIALRRRVEALADVQERLELRLIRADPDPGRKLRLVGWNLGGVGLGLVAAGAVLFAVDGRGLDCPALPGAECPRRQDTRAAAWTVTSLGVAAVVTGTVLLIRGRRPSAERRVEAGLGPRGIRVGGRY